MLQLERNRHIAKLRVGAFVVGARVGAFVGVRVGVLVGEGVSKLRVRVTLSICMSTPAGTPLTYKKTEFASAAIITEKTL